MTESGQHPVISGTPFVCSLYVLYDFDPVSDEIISSTSIFLAKGSDELSGD